MASQIQTQRQATLTEFALYFLKLGCIGFGGPIALVGYMQKDLVEDRKWISQEDYLNGLAFSQLAPGPLAAQLAMYLGFVRAGFMGATVVAVAFVAPSFLMVVAIGKAYLAFGGTKIISALFYGIGAAVIAIIARSAMKLVKTSIKKDKLLWAVFLVLAISTAVTEREIVWLFLAAGLLVMFIRTDFSAWKQRRTALSLVPFGLGVPGSTASLFIFFLKSSLFVFGSGLAIVPFLHGGVVLEHHWLTEAQFVDAVAVAMITPGPVVITVAFIGYLVAGFPGACAAGLGVFLPVYLFVVFVGPFYRRFAQNVQVRAFVQGVTAAATGAIAGAAFVLAKHSIRDFWTGGIALSTLLILMKWKVPEPIIIAAAGLLGLAIHLR
ncbi:MAG TPA: chromate efflux transporter [Candidatus Angelobacter sp.]|jgi:chromate transporter|nr:chromate efflux transporter [Candidatus Angelobacter sp.]